MSGEKPSAVVMGTVSPIQPIIVSVKSSDHDQKPTVLPSSSHVIRWLSLAILTLQNAVLVLIMRYARTRPGDMFISTTAVVMAEVCKLVFCLAVTFYENHSRLSTWLAYLNENILQQPVDFLKISVPAVIYMVQNNLLYVALSNLDAAFFQVTYQLKLLTTALFSVIMLRKQLTLLQWLSLLMLFSGIGVVQLQPQKPQTAPGNSRATLGNSPAAAPHPGGDALEQNTALGVVAVLVACVMSGFAGVYFEKLLKHTPPSICLRNIQLGAIGIVFGLFAAFYNDGPKKVSSNPLGLEKPEYGFGGLCQYPEKPVFRFPANGPLVTYCGGEMDKESWASWVHRVNIYEKGFFHGYDSVVAVIIMLQSVGGILVAVVVKHADNILKGFATSNAIVIACVASVYLFDVTLSGQFIVGTLLVMLSIYFYGKFAPRPI